MSASAHGGNVMLIHACVSNRNDTVRIVSADTTCDARETSLDWSIEGPAGPQGPKGDTGDVGPMGPQGPQGPAAAIRFYKSVQYFTVPAAPMYSGQRMTAAGSAYCEPGDQVTGGGVSVTDPRGGIITSYDAYNPETQQNGWFVHVYGYSELDAIFVVLAECVDVTP